MEHPHLTPSQIWKWKYYPQWRQVLEGNNISEAEVQFDFPEEEDTEVITNMKHIEEQILEPVYAINNLIEENGESDHCATPTTTTSISGKNILYFLQIVSQRREVYLHKD